MKYGFKCPCHGVQVFDTMRQRDSYAITYQCKLELFRIIETSDEEVARHARPSDAAWLTTVGFGGNPAPRGPWRTTDEACESLRRWVRREGADAASLIAAHTIRVYAYTTREAARAGDISDSPGSNGCVSIRGLNDFLGGAL